MAKLNHPKHTHLVLKALGVDNMTGSYSFTSPDVLDVKGFTDAEIAAAEASLDIASLDKQAALELCYMQRAAAYPPQSDYLDAVVKGDTVAQQAYIDACLAVKAKYPKPV